MRSRAFKVRTLEGSRFAMRFDPGGEDSGIAYGRMRVVGYSVLAGRQIEVVGIGCLPEVDGQIVVSAAPRYAFEFEGESVPVFEKETVVAVQEIEVPEAVLEQVTC